MWDVPVSMLPHSGPLFTKKTPSYGYRDPHDKPETVTTVSGGVAYRYRKSVSIIELFVSIISIYIWFLATNF